MNRERPTISPAEMKIIFPDSTTETMEGEPVSISRILDRLAINPSEVIVSRNGRLVPEDRLPAVMTRSGSSASRTGDEWGREIR